MFLNLYLFLLNIIVISFCSIYLKNIYLDDKEFEIIKEKNNKYKENKRTVKIDYQDQLDYIKLKSDAKDIENEKLLYWKILLFLVAIFSAIIIIITEPIQIFGIRFRYMTLILILIVSYFFTKFLQKLGVKI